ncbi:YafY family protein [Hydrogenophaga sp. 5NK40-0174]|uniref:helix-turn-helix transcriptional regulator n=1 Tax=Hydrogenophaga sp. 5NK40-0174 TaxID=3127649 RepID=UPI0031025E4E
MRRADRLFKIVQLIRGRRLTKAQWLADRLEVSVRTVYRDVADLQMQGVPIEGEAGVGYRLGAGYDLPPLMFSTEEAKALAAAMRMALPWLDPGLALAAEDAMSRVMSVLPSDAKTAVEAMALWSYSFDRYTPEMGRHLQQLREAAEQCRAVKMHYGDANDKVTTRVIRPLGCFFWGKVWTLTAWCEHRAAFRTFRIDRVRKLSLLERRFPHEPGKTLKDFLAQLQPPKEVLEKLNYRGLTGKY